MQTNDSQLPKLPDRKWRKIGEKVIEAVLFLAAFSSVAITISIIGILLYESISFFSHVPLWRFFTDSTWAPSDTAKDGKYGIMSLVTGTVVITLVALLVAIPMGTIVNLPSRSFGKRLNLY
jgi:phosphate transport system permease protein